MGSSGSKYNVGKVGTDQGMTIHVEQGNNSVLQPPPLTRQQNFKHSLPIVNNIKNFALATANSAGESVESARTKLVNHWGENIHKFFVVMVIIFLILLLIDKNKIDHAEEHYNELVNQKNEFKKLMALHPNNYKELENYITYIYDSEKELKDIAKTL